MLTLKLWELSELSCPEGVRAWEAGLGLDDEESPKALRAVCFC